MQYLGALAAQFLHTRSDHRKIVGGAGSGALAAQLLHTCSDYGKIVSGAGSGHVSSLYHCELSRRPLTIPSGASAFDDAGEILMTDLRLGAPARGSQGSRSSGCVEQRMPPPSSEGLSKGTGDGQYPMLLYFSDEPFVLRTDDHDTRETPAGNAPLPVPSSSP